MIIGAGAMGRLWAAYLHTAAEVWFATRSVSGPKIDYPMRDATGSRHSISVPVWVRERGLPDCILVMTKAPDAEAALAPFDALLSTNTLLSTDIPVVLFQNGMGSQRTIVERYPGVPIIAASTTEGAYIAPDGLLVHAGKGITWVGGLNAIAQSQAEAAVNYLGLSGLTVAQDNDIEGRLWQKLAINAGINPFTALLDCPNGEILGNGYFEQRIGGVCEEVSTLMNARGRPIPAATLEAQVREIANRTATNSSSMRQDIRAGRQTEIDMMNGFVVRESEALGLSAPVNRELTTAVRALRHTKA